MEKAFENARVDKVLKRVLDRQVVELVPEGLVHEHNISQRSDIAVLGEANPLQFRSRALWAPKPGPGRFAAGRIGFPLEDAAIQQGVVLDESPKQSDQVAAVRSGPVIRIANDAREGVDGYNLATTMSPDHEIPLAAHDVDPQQFRTAAVRSLMKFRSIVMIGSESNAAYNFLHKLVSLNARIAARRTLDSTIADAPES